MFGSSKKRDIKSELENNGRLK